MKSAQIHPLKNAKSPKMKAAMAAKAKRDPRAMSQRAPG
jgi:hypothetical protein